MTLSCIYSSGWGNTRLVVERVKELLLVEWIDMKMINAHVASPEDFLSSEITLLAAPTYDHGVLHAPYEKLLFNAAESDLQWKYYAVIALWDDKYDKEYNMESAVLLEQFVTDHWGILLLDALRINKHPLRALEESLPQWTADLLILAKKYA